MDTHGARPSSPPPDDQGHAAGPDDRVHARRNRLAGLWAAELLGLIGQTAHDYAHDLAESHPAGAGDEPLLRRLARDLGERVSLHEIRDKLAHLLHEARDQIRGDHHGHE